MTSTYTPGREVAAALVAAFRADAAWAAPGGLLFPGWAAPAVDENDFRVYSNHANLPKDASPEIKTALPRILFDVRWGPHPYEQEAAGTLHGPVTVYLHTLVPRAQEEYGERLVAAGMLKVLSTPLSSARIIAAELVPDSDVSKDPIEAFNGAWEWVIALRSRNVGVLM